jgi:hypothetical protein
VTLPQLVEDAVSTEQLEAKSCSNGEKPVVFNSWWVELVPTVQLQVSALFVQPSRPSTTDTTCPATPSDKGFPPKIVKARHRKEEPGDSIQKISTIHGRRSTVRLRPTRRAGGDKPIGEQTSQNLPQAIAVHWVVLMSLEGHHKQRSGPRR